MDAWKRKLRMGMVGGGQGAFIGAVHRMVATLDQQVELVAGVFSRDAENNRTTGAELYLSPDRVYNSYTEMAEAEARLPEDRRIDFVSIVTPNVSHFDISRTFLDAGIHVVCDKPMTYTLDEANRLVEMVEASGLVFALTHNYTGHPMIRQARAMFRSGEMGQVRKVIVEYLQDFLMVPHEKLGMKQAEWRVDPAQSGIGGTMGDVGTHALNLMEYVTGDPVREICADLSTFLPDRELDEDVNALMRFEGGGKGLLTASQISTGEENGFTLRVYAERGAIRWAQETPNHLDVWRYGEPRQTYTRAQGYLDATAAAAGRIPPGHPEGYLEAFAQIYVGAVAAIRRHIDGEPMATAEYDFPTVYDGQRGMQFIYRAVESSQNGATWVAM
jgi:predicted dehydrogenase